MKRTALILLLALAVFACQQKQERKTEAQAPVPSIRMAEDIKMLQEVVKKDPKNLGAWIKLGNYLMDSSRFGEAVDAYGKALELDPNNVDVRVDMGTCYRSSGRPDKAVEEYRKALSINPGHLNGRRNLAVVLAYDLKDRTQAIKEFEKYLELAPNAPDAGQVRQAVQELKAGK